MFRSMHVALPISFIALISMQQPSWHFATQSPQTPEVHWACVPATSSSLHAIRARADIAPLLPIIMPSYCQYVQEARLALPDYARAPGTTSRPVLALYIPALSPIELEVNIYPHLWGDRSIADKRRSEASARTHQLIHTVCGFQASASVSEVDAIRIELLAKHMALFRYKSSRLAEQIGHGASSMKIPSGVAPCVIEWVQAGARSSSAPAVALADSQLFRTRSAPSLPVPTPPPPAPVVTSPHVQRTQPSWWSSPWSAYNSSSSSSDWKRYP
jgi:hypothetical protein